MISTCILFVLVSVWWTIVIYLELLSLCIQHQARPPLQMHLAPWLSTAKEGPFGYSVGHICWTLRICRQVKSPTPADRRPGSLHWLAPNANGPRLQGFGQQSFFFNQGCKMKKVCSSSGWADPTTCAVWLWPHEWRKETAMKTRPIFWRGKCGLAVNGVQVIANGRMTLYSELGKIQHRTLRAHKYLGFTGFANCWCEEELLENELNAWSEEQL